MMASTLTPSRSSTEIWARPLQAPTIKAGANAALIVVDHAAIPGEGEMIEVFGIEAGHALGVDDLAANGGHAIGGIQSTDTNGCGAPSFASDRIA
ncbi:hypothetical protein QEH52_07265 [Coraliomargarita sp. SDUM461003]|uniref:Uncharacterized protein n=1 Tax=Thalassobacterium maritimum TaxID=3041265 RepID=A0ABU1AT27_9BACT|nr:hypothetical protein [Coraliomargarita sp. SDUM461003]MDQ8207301.1 hypothetical protein [Coraliomargarita sp. SDUM461003]